MMSWNLGGCLKPGETLRPFTSTQSTPSSSRSPLSPGRIPATSALQASLTCYLCGDLFKRPRVLPCGHTFCTDCIVKLKGGVLGESQPPTPTTDSDSLLVVQHKKQQNHEQQNNPYFGLTYGLREWDPSPDQSSEVDGFDGSIELCKSWSAPRETNGYGINYNSSSNGHFEANRLSRSQTFTYDRDRALPDSDKVPYMREPRRKDLAISAKSSDKWTNSNRLSAPPSVYSKQQPQQTCSECGSSTRSPSPATLPRRSTRKQMSKSAPLSQRPNSSSPINSNGHRNKSYASSNSMPIPKQKSKTPESTNTLPRWNSSSCRPSSSPYGSATSIMDALPGSFEHRHGREMEQFTCPIPGCNYSLRLMNLARWSPRNRTLVEVMNAWKLQQVSSRNAGTQTEMSTDHSLLVSIPRSLVDSRALQPALGMPQGRRRHSSMVDMAIDSAITMDSLERGYLPRGHGSWRSYAAMVGMNILQQIINF